MHLTIWNCVGHKTDFGGNWLSYGHQCLLPGVLVLLLPFIPGSKPLLPAKKLISVTDNVVCPTV